MVIVDNGSTDGSGEFLQALAEAGLCELIRNQQNNQHGPALSQAVSYLAQKQQRPTSNRPWVWLLDSDCVIARADAAKQAIAAAAKAQAKLLGESYWNPWHKRYQFAGFSLLFDPAVVWQQAIGPIPNGGDPIGEFEQACREQDVPGLSFPFTEDVYLIHRGRSTLAAVRERQETSNPHFEWAQTHYQPHFQKVPSAPARYAELSKAFDEQVPNLEIDALIKACQP